MYLHVLVELYSATTKGIFIRLKKKTIWWNKYFRSIILQREKY